LNVVAVGQMLRSEHELHATVGRIAAHVAEGRIVMPAREGGEVGDEHRVAAEIPGVVDELPGVPLHRPHGEVVVAQRNATAADRGGAGGGPR